MDTEYAWLGKRRKRKYGLRPASHERIYGLQSVGNGKRYTKIAAQDTRNAYVAETPVGIIQITSVSVNIGFPRHGSLIWECP